MRLKIVQFLAVVLTALALVPGGAHVFALPNKVGLAADSISLFRTSIADGACWALFWSAH